MQVKALIEELRDMSEDAEVRLALTGYRTHTQHHLGEVFEVELEDEGCGAQEGDTEIVVYIEVGGQLSSSPYLPGEARDELGV